MASPAQIIANQANAQLSTGPKTAEGKARSAKNSTKHGLTLGVLAITADEQQEFCEFEANLRAEINPIGIFENEAFQQFIDGAWRIRKIEAIVEIILDLCQDDAFIDSDAESELRPLTRYRAAAEMLVYRAVRTLRDLQNARLAREWHLTDEERELFPRTITPPVKIMLNGNALSRPDRELYYRLFNSPPFDGQFSPQNCEFEPDGEHTQAA